MYYEDDEYIEEDYYYTENEHIYQFCIIPTVTQTCKFIFELIMINLLFLFLTRTIARWKERLYHVISALLGIYYIYFHVYSINLESLCLIPLIYFSYLSLIFKNKFCSQHISIKYIIGSVYIVLLISCEFFHPNHDSWLKIRSVVMIAMMKMMSLILDSQEQTVKKEMPSFWAYSGYIWCPANSVLGPWITYKSYLLMYHQKNNINLQRLWSITYHLVVAVLLVCCSNCFDSYFFSDDYNKFVLYYGEALSFRMSHYFISYIATACMLTAGFSDKMDSSSFTITNPFEIEIPRSLVSVVINWNIPMHTFLKKYIFQNFLPYGLFPAVFFTYVISAMLHGLNVEVSVVLLSLGLFSYIQTKFQDLVSIVINACCRAKDCRNCKHKYKKTSQRTILANTVFTILTIVYLAYLGCLMENIDTSGTIAYILTGIFHKWHEMFFIGHILLLLCFTIVTCR